MIAWHLVEDRLRENFENGNKDFVVQQRKKRTEMFVSESIKLMEIPYFYTAVHFP